MSLRAAVMVVLVAAAALASCARGLPARPAVGPVLTPAVALAALESADDARRGALSTGARAPAAAALTGAGLALVDGQAAEVRRSGMRIQEEVIRRRLVYLRWSGGPSAEAVLEVLSRRRPVLAGRSGQLWSVVLAQRQALLVRRGGRWLIESEVELPPDQWRSTAGL